MTGIAWQLGGSRNGLCAQLLRVPDSIASPRIFSILRIADAVDTTNHNEHWKTTVLNFANLPRPRPSSQMSNE